jgi:hypothetical protein
VYASAFNIGQVDSNTDRKPHCTILSYLLQAAEKGNQGTGKERDEVGFVIQTKK